MTLFPMHQAGLDDDSYPCGDCGNLYRYNDLTWVETLPRSWFHEEEGDMVCDECIGETDE